jgi:predicted anti-sigma-YlaC factor YlaD
MSRPNAGLQAEALARAHFSRAVELSAGKQAGPYVSLAESVCVEKRQRAEFERLLKQAIALDPGAQPEWRLANLVMQRRARRLLSRADELFPESP